MGNKHLQRSSVPQFSANKKPTETKYINKEVAKYKDYLGNSNTNKVLVSIRFLQPDFECFSDWDKNEMKSFWRFNQKIHQTEWSSLYSSAGKVDKTGFGYTVIHIDNYPKSDFKEKLSPDITLFETRVDNEIRVHGFRGESIFYICWLDRQHQICK